MFLLIYVLFIFCSSKVKFHSNQDHFRYVIFMFTIYSIVCIHKYAHKIGIMSETEMGCSTIHMWSTVEIYSAAFVVLLSEGDMWGSSTPHHHKNKFDDSASIHNISY